MNRSSLLAIAVLLFIVHAASGGDFPPVEQLPINPQLPDPLVMMDGSRVTSKRQWNEERRPELKALFQHYMYGWR